MKYNLLTVASKSYLPFLDVFLNSFHENCDLNHVNKIYIVDVELGEYRNDLIKSDKIEFIDVKIKDNYDGVHSDGWYNTTKLKTSILKNLIERVPTDESIFMVDSDVMFLKDIFDIIDLDYDIQLTEMAEGSHVSNSGILISHIGSFAVFNNKEKSLFFVNQWTDLMDKLMKSGYNKPHETPAMNLLLMNKKLTKSIKIKSMLEKEVCCDISVETCSKTVHLRSDGVSNSTPLENFKNRFKNIKLKDINFFGFDFSVYLNEGLFKRWVEDDINVSLNSFYGINKNYKRTR